MGMISREHFKRSILLAFFAGGFLATVVVGLVAGRNTAPITRGDWALVVTNTVFGFGLIVALWRLIANNEHERLIEEQGRRYPWITAEYLNDLHAKIIAEEKTQ